VSGDDKQAFRERVWAGLQQAGAARFPGARGRIPNFTGAEAAAARIAGLREWERASALKANPDSPQLPVRTRALDDGKIVYMAVPKLADAMPFFALDPARLRVPPMKAASIKGAASAGKPVSFEQMRPLDLVVCGSVVVNRAGARIGKGGGFSDLEFALATEAGLIGAHTVVATTVHPVQVLDEDLPETEHDFRVDLIVTPDEIIRTAGGHRPLGIIWDHLDDEKIAAIPALAARRPAQPPRA
jgi:5-formyltetrahydrofolate cyclo-ligase